MANPIKTAERTARATQRLLRAVQIMQKDLKPEKRVAVGGVSKDADVRQAELLESLADFLEGEFEIEPMKPPVINHGPGIVTEPPVTNDPATMEHHVSLGHSLDPVVPADEPASQPATPPDDGSPDPATGEGGSTPEEPLFHGKPLSFYASMTDDEILDIDGIGEVTLKKIRDAQEAAQ